MAITFQRNLSPFLTDFFATRRAEDRRAYNSQLAAEITLKDASVLYWATASIIIDSLSIDGASVAHGPLLFDGRLSGAPDIRIGQTKAPDTGTLEVVNLDFLLSTAITDENRVFERAKLRLYLAFPKGHPTDPVSTYEGVILFDGYLDEAMSDDQSGQLSLIADINDRAAIVGKEITQRCMNELGDSWCGVPPGTLPPGAECSKIHDDILAGCAYWGGVFNGVPYLDPLIARSTGNNGEQPPWEEPDQPECPCIETTWFKAANGGAIHAKDLRAGEPLIWHDDEIVIVEAADRVYAPYRYLVKTASGADQIVSATHHFLTNLEDDRGRACTNWKFGEWSLVANTPKGIQSLPPSDVRKRNFTYSFKPLGPGEVLKLAVSGSHRYWSGMHKGFYLGSHNRKDDWPLFV